MRFFYTTGVAIMVAAFPFWFVAVVADNTTAGAVGMLTFVLGVLVTAVGAAMDYRWHLEDRSVDEYREQTGQDGAPKRLDADNEWPRP